MRIAFVMIAAVLVAIPGTMLAAEKAKVISAHAVSAQLDQLAALAKAKGSSGSKLAASGNLALNLSVRTTSGGAEVHAHFDDLMIVQAGKATLITGGTVVNARTASNGDVRGSGIDNGISRTVVAGDVIIVPAGVPHQLLVAPGDTYSSLVAKVKE